MADEQPAGIPLRLLLQRRQVAAGYGRVSGRTDFACEDNRRLARRHEAAGARVAATFPRWVVMADPAGRRSCLTMREPWPASVSGARTGPAERWVTGRRNSGY